MPTAFDDGAAGIVPFNTPSFLGRELEYARAALDQRHISGDGPFTKRAEQMLEHILDIPRVLLTTSCTHALELAALMLDLRPGDEVIMPPYTFVSTANAVVLRGAKPVFVDIREDTLNLDERLVRDAVTSRTKAIFAVHYAGVACEMDALMELAKMHDIAIVEDNAHGLFGTYKGRRLGTFGRFAALSFHETKNITCGEGGALLIRDRSDIERAEIMREKGTNRSKFYRGEVDKYTWVDVGSSYILSDLLAGILTAQLECADEIQDRRSRLWHRYRDGLACWADLHDVRLPYVPPDCEHPFHMFYLIMPTEADRDAFITYLRSHGIQAVFHYLPLHLSPMGRTLESVAAACPVATDLAGRLVRLPFFTTLDEKRQQRVIEVVQSFTPRGVPA